MTDCCGNCGVEDIEQENSELHQEIFKLKEELEVTRKDRDDYRIRCDQDWHAQLIGDDLATPEGRALYRAVQIEVERKYSDGTQQKMHEFDQTQKKLKRLVEVFKRYESQGYALVRFFDGEDAGCASTAIWAAMNEAGIK